MPSSFSSAFTPQLLEVIQRAQAGDPQARLAAESFRNAPELSAVAKPVDVVAQGTPAGMMSPGLASLQQDLPTPQSSPSLGATPAFAQQQQDFGSIGATRPRPHDWGKIAQMASIGFSSLGSALGGRVKADPGVVNQMMAQQYQQDQQDQLQRRHGMWDLAFKQSQELPPQIIADPKFASLAQAKAALEADMQDGKVDNEKNVSLFLTELARFKPELDQLAIDTKVQQQVGMEGKLQKGREAAGLAMPMEQQDFNFEGTPVTRTEFLKLSDIRRQKDEANQTRLDIAKENAEARKFAASEGAANRAAMMRAQDADRVGSAVRQTFQQNMQRFYKADPFTGEFPEEGKTRQRALVSMKDMLFEGAGRSGYRVQEPNMINGWQWQVNDKTFSPDEAGTSEMLEYLASKLGVQ